MIDGASGGVISIHNLFNENYYSYVSDGFSTVIPAQGRSLYTGFKYNF